MEGLSDMVFSRKKIERKRTPSSSRKARSGSIFFPTGFTRTETLSLTLGVKPCTFQELRCCVVPEG